jgi:hypothetical protein
MLVCEAPELVSRPDWTSLVCGDVELCNSLEAPNWTELVVQVLVCEACRQVGCTSGARVERTCIAPGDGPTASRC